ncbi:WXG100 family type VII secretion target [Lentzea nigeriaca]|uniref:WXG100 family type VII secretion target n=1 Tax=Lentzea nigeriaca TaxID=1128665 RepID=UPI00195B2E6F|nr:WXG100 family type VII secretion target [Lentzea nigeriaca]MBM7859720.1 WXG100 family type VII secretion target [Lentzea nigeriaca]
MTGTSVTTDDLDRLAKHILEIDEQTQGTLRSVRSAADTVRGSWDGTAAQAFTQLIERFDDDTRRVQEALRSIAEQISESAKTYIQNEEAQTSAVSDIAGRLG